MAASVDAPPALPASLPDAVPPAAMWLPGSALACYEGDAVRRSWLLTPGLLTQRIREAAGARFAMHVLREGPAAADGTHVREIDMCCGGEVWLFAHTRVPAATLAAQPWLAAVGARTLGEALADHDTVLEREPLRYATLGAEAWVVRCALAHAGLPPGNLWVRHAAFRAGGAPFDLYEAFLPGMGGGR
jgi:chorismate-pyruvate lyase